MATSEERKELADRMRCFDVTSDAGGRYWLNGTLFGMDISARSEERIRVGMVRLADLIEPVCDRDALLALADSITDMRSYPHDDSYRELVKVSYQALNYIAHRIREACGEEE